MATTNYYVLQVNPHDDEGLHTLGTAEAATGEAAIRKVAKESNLDLDGRFVAVPVRNWTEIEFETVARDPVVTANYISERRRRAPQPTPGQTTIEEEIEAEALAAEIEGDELPEGDSDVGFVNPDEGVEDPEEDAA